MKLFIHFDEDGQILSVAKVHAREDQQHHPFMHVANPDQVAEVELPPDMKDLNAHEIAGQYEVDPKSKRLKKKSTGKARTQPESRTGRARKSRSKDQKE
jgi:hypothetical protein